MVYRLRNQSDPLFTLSLTSTAWNGILELAGVFGWNRISAHQPGEWVDEEYALAGYYLGQPLRWQDPEPVQTPNQGLADMILEDALNLADALEKAFVVYEPLRVPISYYLFDTPEFEGRPSVGAISLVIDFCRRGPFWIEHCP